MKNKNASFLLISACLVLALAATLMLTCKQPTTDTHKTPETGETRLLVEIHDMPFKKDGKNVEHLNITVLRMDIIDANDNHITILDEPRSMDILAVSRDDPVALSNVAVEPGIYKELRLVLSDDSTIQVDGEIFPIKIPSGEQSGLKLKGPFEIPRGKLFRLTIDFVATESVIYNKGQGYMLKPVLRISDTSEITGIFRGKMTVAKKIGVGQTLVELHEDGTARLRVASYPRYTVKGRYSYNSASKILLLDNFDLSAPGLKQWRIDKIMKKFPKNVQLTVKQWSLDNIIAIDTAGVEANLYKVDEFNFSSDAAFTDFVLNVDYPDASSSGKDAAAVIEFIDTGMPVQTITGTFEGTRFSERVQIPNDYLLSANTRIRITAYLFDDPDDLNTEMGVYANMLTELMTGSRFSASTLNPWQPPTVFTLQRDPGYEQEFTLSFPMRMNVKVDHKNFTENKPAVSWAAYPGANNGYFVLASVQNKDYNPALGDISGNRPYKPAFHKHTLETNATLDSEMISFVQEPGSYGPPSINMGDHIIVEVYVLDGSGLLDSANKKGALFMDAVKVIRK
ncbi:MAG: DUF4382 domain-containing protein [Treponema sp.]|nr:DUF4382 domain-containing protein [Treponema sp.]